MSSKRVYLLLIGAIGVLFLGLLVGTYEINSLMSHKASELTKVKAKSLALDEEQKSLVKAKKDIKKYEDLHAITQAVVPEDKNQAEAVRQIVSIADKNNIALASITFPASTLGGTGAGVSAPASANPAGSSTGKSAGSLSQLTAVKEINGVYSLTITVTSDPTKPVPYNQFVNFLNDLEHNRRTAQVNTVSIEPKKENRNVLSFTLTLNEYIKP